jgi:hypothetical protein
MSKLARFTSNHTNGDNITLTRSDLAARWKCSIQTIKRRERDSTITALRFGPRMIRFRLADIVAYESGGLSHVALETTTKSCQILK